MKRKWMLTMLCMALCTGCTMKSSQEDLYLSRIDAYETDYTAVLGNGHYADESADFTISY